MGTKVAVRQGDGPVLGEVAANGAPEFVPELRVSGEGVSNASGEVIGFFEPCVVCGFLVGGVFVDAGEGVLRDGLVECRGGGDDGVELDALDG